MRQMSSVSLRRSSVPSTLNHKERIAKNIFVCFCFFVCVLFCFVQYNTQLKSSLESAPFGTEMMLYMLKW